MISWLRLLRIEDVNDVRNLAPACRRCNTKKGRQRRNLGAARHSWQVRGILGAAEGLFCGVGRGPGIPAKLFFLTFPAILQNIPAAVHGTPYIPLS